MQGGQQTVQMKRVTVGLLSTNCYLLWREDREDCVVIDPGANAEKIRAAMGGRSLAAILLTHGHFDHIGAVDALMGPGTELVVHTQDEPMLHSPELNVCWMIDRTITCRRATRTVEEGDLLVYAGMAFRVLHTPGHTPGGVCYECGGMLFTGDTMFDEGWGRTDLPGGSEAELMASLRRLMPLRDTHEILGGHG